MDYLFLCSNIQDMKSLETNERKAKSQAYSLHIPMWDTNNQQTIFIKDVILEGMKEVREWKNVRELIELLCISYLAHMNLM